ncbi:MAG: Undecaprenyl-phosphate 4-deoxy-4-formamido-L-arabinose transferase [Elusimicrobia bacterium ADurb.Bin231]|nr:MAG: Undecaprenyl-phosphate 4-deoxy-4-formamido-L-arabinose transferase [Elusimicrobia bacterium ADurb.Bin231]
MYRENKIVLVIPARNEEKLILDTLKGVPEYVDKVYVIDDCSTDSTAKLVREYSTNSDKRVELISHSKNLGPGAAIITGYKHAVKEKYDVAVVCGGDNQMPLDQMRDLIDPIIEGKADYTKGNRFMEGSEKLSDMPLTRVIGNTIISFLTKIASGYYKIFDVVDGFTAINKKAISAVDWDKAWKGYGYPMDFLVRMNVYRFKVLDVPRRAIYLPGVRQSQIKGLSYALRVSPMLLRNFFFRLYKRYFLGDFHPLIFMYIMGMLMLAVGVFVGLFILTFKIKGGSPTGATAILSALFIISGGQLFLFGMLFDMMEEKK